MRHLIDPMDLSVEDIDRLLDRADDIAKNPEKYQEVCKHKKLATLFFEPSTRTRLSFEAAMLELGGSVLGFSSADSSSASKGESVADTARVIECYADIIAMRHPKEGAPYVASQYVNIPVINAGDGGHNHPTQTLTDLLTIRREKGRGGKKLFPPRGSRGQSPLVFFPLFLQRNRAPAGKPRFPPVPTAMEKTRTGAGSLYRKKQRHLSFYMESFFC